MNEPSQEPANRPDDSGYNNPSRLPQKSKPITGKAASGFDDQEVPPEAISGEVDDPSHHPALASIQAIRRFMRTSLLLVLLGIAVVGLYVYATALDLIRQVTSYPLYLQWPVWLLIGVVLSLLLVATFKVAFLWRSLLRQPQVTFDQADPDDARQAKAQLLPYAKGVLDLADKKRPAWESLWRKDPDRGLRLLEDCRLLTKPRPIEDAAWLEAFEATVRQPLDGLAKETIWRYGRLIGVKTAVSPFPLVDSLAVLYNNFLLLGDLSLLYGRRLSRHEIIVLLWVIIFQVFVATQSQELFDSVAEEMSQTIQSGLARNIAGYIAPKVAEGTLHAMVTWRIGKRAQRLLRPVK